MIRPLPLMLLCASLGCATLTGCTNEPELRDRVTPDLRQAAYPDLLPSDQLVPSLPTPQDQGTALEQELEARSARLDRRAEALRRASN